MRKFRLQKNTDTVDTSNHCLGVSAWVEGDSVNMLNTNRGLHIQIRHNNNDETFEAACELANLVSAAPDLMASLQWFVDNIEVYTADAEPKAEVQHALRLLKKIKGET